jgi:hypothetical protein
MGMPDDPLAGEKGWPGMAQGQTRGAALAAARAVAARERARDCPRLLAVFAGPSWQGQEPAGASRPAAEPAADRRPPAPSRPAAVVAPVPCLARAGRARPRCAAARMTAFPGSSRFAVEPLAREIPARYAPSAGRRGYSCVLSGPELSDRPLADTSRRNASLVVTLRGDMPTVCATVSGCGIVRAPSAGGRAHRGALPADTTRKGEFAMRDTWT